MPLKEHKSVMMRFIWRRGNDDITGSLNGQPGQSLFHDRSLWFLLLANGVTTILAVTQNWNLLGLMWVYWFQNLVIGFFHFRRIRQLREFSTKGFTINRRPVEPTEETKNQVARSFLVHYGMFHFVYFMFLLAFSQYRGLGSADLIYIVPTALLFLGNHIFSYRYNGPRDIGRPNIGTIMMYPYARVIPMHLTLILGAFLGGGLLLFLLLKTLADVIMHVVEHRVLLKGKVRQT
jgi:hypothetical protein